MNGFAAGVMVAAIHLGFAHSRHGAIHGFR